MADTTTPTPTFELVHDQASPTPPPRPLRGNSREISSEKMPEQNLANSPNKLAKSASGTSANTMSSLAEQFHSVRSHGMFLLPEYYVAFSQKNIMLLSNLPKLWTELTKIGNIFRKCSSTLKIRVFKKDV